MGGVKQRKAGRRGGYDTTKINHPFTPHQRPLFAVPVKVVRSTKVAQRDIVTTNLK
jgi:hypothetical protein